MTQSSASDSAVKVQGEGVRAMFSRIAGSYDQVNDLLSLGIHRAWKRKLIQEAGPLQGLRYLDVATGTGDLALRVAQAQPAPAQVVGADFCAPMLEVARRRAETLKRYPGSPGVEFVEADALKLPFADASFDRISVAFGVRNFENPEAGLAELWRVLAPGGRLLVLEFGDWASGRGALAAFRSLGRKIIPGIGGAVSGDSAAYRYLFETSSLFPAGSRFLPWLKVLPGARAPRARSLSAGIAWLYCADKA